MHTSIYLIFDFQSDASDAAQKEYIDNIRTIMKRDCETHRKTIDCHALAEFYLTIDKNYTDAGRIFTDMCETRKHAASCLQAGMQAMLGKGEGMVMLLLLLLLLCWWCIG